MKRLSFIFFSIIHFSFVFAQKLESEEISRISNYLEEIKESTKKASSIWNKDLYGNILLVVPETRQFFTNQPDAPNSLQTESNLFTGTLPENLNIANTSIQWNGKCWAMIMLPLPEDKFERINLLAHELFHCAQPSLGFVQNNQESPHLDKKEGRIYLRLEMEALLKALLSETEKEQKRHLTHAFIFRKYRNSLFPESAQLENLLELNEGIAEYTGLMVSGRTKNQTKEHFISSINEFFKNSSYVRSFAYYTIPIYGYLLSFKIPFWNQNIHSNSQLIDFFIEAFELQLPADVKPLITHISNEYNGETIFAEEEKREERIKQEIADYKRKFTEKFHVELKFEQMNISFDPRNLTPLEEMGTIYPTLRLTDNWGILEVNKGALISINWDKITLSHPTKIALQTIEGDGWLLQLNENYSFELDEKNNIYGIRKN